GGGGGGGHVVPGAGRGGRRRPPLQGPAGGLTVARSGAGSHRADFQVLNKQLGRSVRLYLRAPADDGTGGSARASRDLRRGGAPKEFADEHVSLPEAHCLRAPGDHDPRLRGAGCRCARWWRRRRPGRRRHGRRRTPTRRSAWRRLERRRQLAWRKLEWRELARRKLERRELARRELERRQLAWPRLVGRPG